MCFLFFLDPTGVADWEGGVGDYIKACRAKTSGFWVLLSSQLSAVERVIAPALGGICVRIWYIIISEAESPPEGARPLVFGRDPRVERHSQRSIKIVWNANPRAQQLPLKKRASAIFSSALCPLCSLFFLPRFVEYGEYKGNYYGTSLDSVRSILSKNKVCLLDVQPHVSDARSSPASP